MDEMLDPAWTRTLEFQEDPQDCIDGARAYGLAVVWPKQGPLVGLGMLVIAGLGGCALLVIGRYETSTLSLFEWFALGALFAPMASTATFVLINRTYSRAMSKVLAERRGPENSSIRFEFHHSGYDVATALAQSVVKWELV